MSMHINDMKKNIINNIKDLDKTDYIDICKLIKFKSHDYSMVKTTEKGTYIDLDKVNDELINEIYSMVHTKIQRIKNS